VPVGPVYVQSAFRTSSASAYVGANGTVTDGQTLTLNLAWDGGGTLAGNATTAAGAAATNYYVYVQAFGGGGRDGWYHDSQYVSTGGYSFSHVPAGPVHIMVHDNNDWSTTGVADGMITSGGTLVLDAQYGNGVDLRANLDGADGFRYDVNGDGTLADGGTIDGRLRSAYSSDDSLQLNGLDTPWIDTAAIDSTGRTITFGPMSVAGLIVTRKLFVPAAGGFARYLEIVSNPATAPIPATLALGGTYGSSWQTRVVVAPASTGDTYSVTDANGNCCYPVLAHVFQGAGSPLVGATTTTINGNGTLSLVYNVTIGAGATVILMHFEVQRDTTDATGAGSAATALVNLTDSNALAAMSDAEKAAVVNFLVPASSGRAMVGDAPMLVDEPAYLVETGELVIERAGALPNEPNPDPLMW
jgi:hypothetical protein